MMQELQKKITRMRKRYDDETLPMESRHTLELVVDLADLLSALEDRVTFLLSALEDRVTNLEGRVNHMNKTFLD